MTQAPVIIALCVAAFAIMGLSITVLALKRALRVEPMRSETWQDMAENATKRTRIKQGVLLALTQERDEARARLAVFTAPRQRNAKGHYLPNGGKA